MTVTREQLVKKLASETGFYQKDLRLVFDTLGDVMLEYFNKATEDDDILVQLFSGCKVGCSIVPERTRVNPRTQEKVICKPTVKPKAQFSMNFRRAIQENYDEKMGE